MNGLRMWAWRRILGGLPSMTEEEYEREFIIGYALSYIGTFYSWGGDDPMGGFDCSGFVSELMQAAGKIGNKERLTAQGLADRFADKVVSSPRGGRLLLLRKNGKIFHVEMCIDSHRSIGSMGGGSSTKTKEDAIRDNAFIKVRPIEGRWAADVEKIFVDPWME